MTSEQRIDAGRLREAAYARFLNNEINEAEFLAIAAVAMKYIPEQFIDWLQGYALSRFEVTK